MPLSEHQPRALAVVHVVLVDLEGSFDLTLQRYFVQITREKTVDQINTDYYTHVCDTDLVDRAIPHDFRCDVSVTC